MTSSFVFSIVAVVIGILCAIFTEFSIKIIVIALGGAAVIKGLFDLFKLNRLVKNDSIFHRTVVIRGLISIVVGLAAVAFPIAFFDKAENIIKLFLYILGIYFIVNALSGFLVVRKLSDANLSTKSNKSESVICLLIAVLLFFIAAIGARNILRIAGIVVAVFGALGALYSWRNKSDVIVPDSVEDVKEEKSSPETFDGDDGLSD